MSRPDIWSLGVVFLVSAIGGLLHPRIGFLCLLAFGVLMVWPWK